MGLTRSVLEIITTIAVTVIDVATLYIQTVLLVFDLKKNKI